MIPMTCMTIWVANRQDIVGCEMNEIKRHKMHGYVIRISVLGIIIGINLFVTSCMSYFFRMFLIDVLILGLIMAVLLDIQEAEALK